MHVTRTLTPFTSLIERVQLRMDLAVYGLSTEPETLIPLS